MMKRACPEAKERRSKVVEKCSRRLLILHFFHLCRYLLSSAESKMFVKCAINDSKSIVFQAQDRQAEALSRNHNFVTKRNYSVCDDDCTHMQTHERWWYAEGGGKGRENNTKKTCSFVTSLQRVSTELRSQLFETFIEISDSTTDIFQDIQYLNKEIFFHRLKADPLPKDIPLHSLLSRQKVEREEIGGVVSHVFTIERKKLKLHSSECSSLLTSGTCQLWLEKEITKRLFCCWMKKKSEARGSRRAASTFKCCMEVLALIEISRDQITSYIHLARVLQQDHSSPHFYANTWKMTKIIWN